eukprot:6886863-Lingulodinium_polyedra.AAC.1
MERLQGCTPVSRPVVGGASDIQHFQLMLRPLGGRCLVREDQGSLQGACTQTGGDRRVVGQ